MRNPATKCNGEVGNQTSLQSGEIARRAKIAALVVHESKVTGRLHQGMAGFRRSYLAGGDHNLFLDVEPYQGTGYMTCHD